MPREKSAAGMVALLAGTATLFVFAAGAGVLLNAAQQPRESLGGPWTLTAADGRTVTDRDFRGRFLLIYFGYASCKDVCPTALSTVQAAVQQLGPKAAELQPLFISVDASRDTPAVLEHYTRTFGPALLGLTGTAAQLAAVQREFHVQAISQHDVEGGHPEELIDHTSVLFLIEPDGRTVIPLPADGTAEGLADRLSTYLS